VTDAHTRHPHSQIWGNGTKASSDGQFFRANDRAARRGDINLHYGSQRTAQFFRAPSSNASSKLSGIPAVLGITNFAPFVERFLTAQSRVSEPLP